MTPRPDMRALGRYLRRGGVIAYPTESCFGLGCDPRNARAVARILHLKGRPRRKGLILVGSDFLQFKSFLDPVTADLAARFSRWWPGPTTLLLAVGARCPKWLCGRHAKLAVRVTAHPETARLCHGLHMALVSTSANRAGRRPVKTFAACRRQFGQRVRVIPGRVGRRNRPSTILDPIDGAVLRA